MSDSPVVLFSTPAELPVARWIMERAVGLPESPTFWAMMAGQARAHFDGSVSDETIGRVVDVLRDAQEELRRNYRPPRGLGPTRPGWEVLCVGASS